MCLLKDVCMVGKKHHSHFLEQVLQEFLLGAEIIFWKKTFYQLTLSVGLALVEPLHLGVPSKEEVEETFESFFGYSNISKMYSDSAALASI